MKTEHSTITKVTITTTRKEMWENYVKSIMDIARDLESETVGKLIAEAHRVLLSNTFGGVERAALHKLFKDGDTFLLLPESDEYFDKPNVHREIYVEDVDLTIDHFCINF